MRLVVQGLSIQNSHLERLAELCASNRREDSFIQTSSQACYLRLEGVVGDKTRHEIEIYCISHFIDWALVPDHHLLSNMGLLVMDMDSTLINIECID